jgi:hypothetical protein
MKGKSLWTISVMLALVVLVPVAALAAAVGHFTQVEGNVDLLKGGKLPGVPVKAQDGVEQGDVIRTKANSKAQIKLLDDSILTIAPDSRVAITEFMYDPARNERRATLRLLKGLTHTVVTRILQVQEPDFLMQTVTAIVGVRGTEWYSLRKADADFFYLTKGIKRALRVISADPKILGVLFLDPWQGAKIFFGRGPELFRFTAADLEMLKKWMVTGVPAGALFEAPGGGGPSQSFGPPKDPIMTLPPTIPPTLQGPPQHQQKPGGGEYYKLY